MKTAVVPFSLALPLLAGGCTWTTVPTNPEAAHVAAVDGSQVAHCQLLSQTELSAGTQLGQFQRLSADVEADLQTLAVNRAPDAGADTVAPLSVMKDGKQTYGFYRCGPTPAGTAVVAPAPQVATSAAPAAATVKTIPYNPPR